MASIWHQTEEKTYNISKADVGFTKWRVAVMERIAVLAGIDETAAVARLHDYGLEDLGLAYDRNETAETVAQRLGQ